MSPFITSSLFTGMVAALLLASCSGPEKLTEKIIERAPPADITESFTVPAGNKNALVVKKESLGKAFLLIASSKELSRTPQWKDHVVRVVSLEKHGDRLGLYELSTAQVYDSISASRLLQSFPIISENEQEIAINFGTGFTSIDFSENLEGFDRDPFKDGLAQKNSSLNVEVIQSLVRNKLFENNRLKIVQDSRVRTKAIYSSAVASNKANREASHQPVLDIEFSLQTHYELIPYKKNEAFRSQKIDEKMRVGLFTFDVVLPGKQEVQKTILRWDVSPEREPIRFIISKDTPSKYLPEIEKGLQYWNRVFGRQVLKVEKSEDRDLLPTDRAVLVRWVDWKDAGMAYAGFQFDPLSGEILRGQIFLPSSWGEKNADLMSFYGLAQEAQDKFVSSKLVSTVAHEAGHIFGLRHNFAGSFAVKTPASLLERVRSLFKQGRTEEEVVVTSSSVMDYSESVDDFILGKYIEKENLAYDKDVIEWAYFGKADPETQPEHFCTDEHLLIAEKTAAKIVGCERRDRVGNPLMMALLKKIESFEKQPMNFMSPLITSMYPEKNKRAPISPYMRPTAYSTQDSDLQNWLFEKKSDAGVTLNPIIDIESVTAKLLQEMFPQRMASSSYKQPGEALKPFWQDLKAQTNYAQIVFPITENGELDWSWGARAIEKVLADTSWRKGKTLQGVEYELTVQDLADIAAHLRASSGTLSSSYLFRHLQELLPSASSKSNFRIPEFGDEVLPRVFGHFKELLSKKGDAQVIGVVLGEEFSAEAYVLQSYDVESVVAEFLRKQTYSTKQLGIDLKPVKAAALEPLRPLMLKLGISNDTDLVSALYAASGQGKIDSAVLMWAQSVKNTAENLKKLPDEI